MHTNGDILSVHKKCLMFEYIRLYTVGIKPSNQAINDF